MKVKKLDAYPPNVNPFLIDLHNMGTRVGSNCMVMHWSHPSEKAASIIIINTETGERIQVTL